LLSLSFFRSRSWLKPKMIAIALPITILIFGMFLRAYLWNHFIGPLGGQVDYERYMADYSRIIYFPTYNRLDALTVGVVIAILLNFKSGFKQWNENFSNVSALVGLAFLAVACWLTQDRFSFFAAVFSFPAFAIGYGGLVLSATASRSILNRLRLPGAATLATLSYSLYLVHFRFLESRDVFKSYSVFENELAMLVAIFSVALLGATALHLLVERPFLRLKARMIKETKSLS
jgi:peptidoglycan/LPS O-acetylase OafA/YrhL